jgi:peptide deformylase
MKRLKVSEYPAEVLKKKAKTVKKFGPALQSLADQMFDIMYETDGVGLAAPQVGISERIVVIDSRQSPKEKMVLVNPVIVKREGEATMQEGCLSVPGPFRDVKRAARVEVVAQDVTGKKMHVTAEGLLARIMQHEIDHLEGLLFIDRLDLISREQALADWREAKEGSGERGNVVQEE